MRAANAIKSRHAFEDDDDFGMMSSINDLIDDGSSKNNNNNNNNKQANRTSKNVVAAGSSPPRPNLPTNNNSSTSAAFKTNIPFPSSNSATTAISSASHPKLTSHLLSGLKTIEQDFERDLGSDWWSRSTSIDTSSSGGEKSDLTSTNQFRSDISSSSFASSKNVEMGSAAGFSSDFSVSSSNNVVANNNNNSNQPPSGVSPAREENYNNNHHAFSPSQGSLEAHQFAADGSDKTQDVIKRLEKLSHSALLTYAARISILLGNFYRLAQENAEAGNNNSHSGSFNSNSNHNNSHFSGLRSSGTRSLARGDDDGGSSQYGIIDFYSYTSRPESSMTTFSDAPIGFSASTMSLAHLPSAPTNNKVEVSGDVDEGTKTINDYVIVAPIGSGSQGTVELGVTLAGEPRAIKALKRSALMKQNEAAIRREVAIMKKLRHDNVVRLFEVIDDPNANMLYLVMKYCSNGPLVHVRPDFTCDTMPLGVARSLLRQLLSGLHYLHLRRIVHRDIKPDNILLDHANVPCFVDFGVSGTVHKKSRTTTQSQGAAEGTPAFWAPELFVRKRDEQKRSAGTPGKDGVPLFPAPPVDLMAADVYSLGATFYTAVIGKTPFTCETAEKLEEAVINEPLKFPSFLPPAWKDLFIKMMDKDPQRRAKIPTLKIHAVFTDDGQDPGSPVDDVKVSDQEIYGAVTKLKGKSGYEENSSNDVIGNNKLSTTSKPRGNNFLQSGSRSQQDALGNLSDDDHHHNNDNNNNVTHHAKSANSVFMDSDGNLVASTPRGNNRAMFHRRVATSNNNNNNRKVAASFSHNAPASNSGEHVVASSSNNNNNNSNSNNINNKNRAISHSPGASNPFIVVDQAHVNDNNTLLPRSYSTARMPLKNIVRANNNNSNQQEEQTSATARSKLPPLKSVVTTARPASAGK
jgi:serine/threonine protein kinase